MESFSTLRYFPRTTVLCFIFVCAMFLICTFYTVVIESRNRMRVYNYLDASETDNDLNPKNPPAAVVVRRHGQSEYAQVLYPAAASNVKLTYATNSSNIKLNKKKTVHASTKYIYLNLTSALSTSTSVPIIERKSVSDTCHLSMKEPKLILLWTSFFDYWNYLPKERFQKCSRCRNCEITKDRSRLLESDAVIFHARDMSITDMPSVRLPHQRWVFYCLESPPYSDFPGLQHTQEMFNWTMTYRSDSDIFSPYGTFVKKHLSQKLDLQSLKWAWSNKTKSVVWMSSHCPTDGGRDLYVDELRKHLDVDVYGSCGKYVCPPGKTEQCLEEFSSSYKFFLAFENSICKDYITEKFYRTFKYNIVPVVFGGADYHRFAPPGSFVDALSFKSPKHLAFFLTGVGNNFKLYSKFFQWRKDYAVKLSNSKECDLCAKLHRKDLKPSSYSNLREWWVMSSKCKTWKPKR